MINYKQQNDSDLTTVNCELKDVQDDSDLSVTEHPSVGGPDIQQYRFPVMTMRFQEKMRVTGQL